MVTLSDLQAAQAAALTDAFKSATNRDAAKIAALIALYYQQRVDPEDTESVERWLEIMVPRLIRSSDTSAERARIYFDAARRLELDGVNAPAYRAEAAIGVIDPGVRASLLTVGPYDYANKMRDIRSLDVGPQQEKALIAEAKQVTTKKLAAAVVRHAQAGGRQTIFDNAQKDQVALGWVRVTRADPCAFCAMLASRGLRYRAFREDSFVASNAQFTGDGDAKVHDECGCSMKAVYSTNDPLVARTEKFNEMWSMWGAGGRGQTDPALRFRRGYDHFRKTGEYLTWDEADAAQWYASAT